MACPHFCRNSSKSLFLGIQNVYISPSKSCIFGAFLVTEPEGASGLLRGLRGGSRFLPAALAFGDDVLQVGPANTVPAGCEWARNWIWGCKTSF